MLLMSHKGPFLRRFRHYMKQTILSVLVLTLLLTHSSAQTKEAEKLSEVGLRSCDHTTSHLDNFLIYLMNNPNYKGYVIYYDGYQLAKNRRYVIWQEASYRLHFFKRWLKGREKVDESRIVYVNGGYRNNYGAEFWLVPEGAETPKPSKTVNPKDKKLRSFKVIKERITCGEEGY